MSSSIENELKKYLSEQITLSDYLKILPSDDTNYNFDFYTTKLVEKKKDINKYLEEILKKSNEYDDNVVYAAFYSLCIDYRRLKDITKFEKIVEEFKDKFFDKPTFEIQQALLLKSKSSKENILEALDIMDNIIDKFNDNPGIIQAYSDTVALAFEDELIDVTVPENKSILNKSIQLIKKAIRKREYPKYYCTLGRLYGIKKNYNEAISYIRKAMDKEDSSNKDYQLRIGDYQSHLIKINLKEYYDLKATKFKSFEDNINEYEEKMKGVDLELKKVIEETRSSNITFLGFFTAILSLIIGSIQIASKMNMNEAIKLILVLFGGLISVFCCLNLLFTSGTKNTIKSIVIFLLGMLIIVLTLKFIPNIVTT